MSVAVGDFTNTGHLSVVVLDQANNRLLVLLGNGSGGFAAPQAYQVGSTPYSVAVGDVNGDGSLDLVTANGGGSGTVSVLLNNGNGGFGTAVDYASGPFSTGVTIADFTGDGKPDLAVTVVNTGTIQLFVRNGNGTFSPVRSTNPLFALGMTVADFNGDGHLDVAATGPNFTGPDSLAVLLSKGDGTLQKPILFAISQPFALLSATLSVTDLKGDFAPDLVVPNLLSPSVTVLLNTASVTTHFTVSAPAERIAGTSFTFTVTPLTQFGAIDKGYVGTVHFSSTDQQAGLPADYTFVPSDQGVRTFTATLKTAGLQTVRVTDTAEASVTGQAVVNILADVVTHFSLTAAPGQRVGVPFLMTVTALDAYGNVASYVGRGHFITWAEETEFTRNYTFQESDQGVYTFLMEWGTEGTQTLTVRDKQNHDLMGSEVFFVLGEDD